MAKKQPKVLHLPLDEVPPRSWQWTLVTGNLETNMWVRTSALTPATRRKYGLS